MVCFEGGGVDIMEWVIGRKMKIWVFASIIW